MLISQDPPHENMNNKKMTHTHTHTQIYIYALTLNKGNPLPSHYY
jgi:hypothetical protein